MWLLFVCTVAWSQDEVDPEKPDEHGSDDTVFVYQPDGTPRVAGSAHVITEEELQTHEYDDIGRVLAQTPGIYVRDEDGFGLRPNIGLRGANSDRSAKITLLEDGVPLVPAPYAAPAAYYFPMATRLTGVEVFKGVASTQHGPQTIGGAINLLTRDVPTRSAGTLDLAYGPRNTAKVHGWGALANPRFGVMLEAAHLQTDGFKQLASGEDTGFERTDLLSKWRLSAGDHELVAKLGYGTERSRETYLGLHRIDFDADPLLRYPATSQGLMRWSRTQAELSWVVKTGSVRIQTVAYHHALSRSWTKFNRFADGPPVHTLLQQDPGGQSAVFLDILRGRADSTTDAQLLQIGTNTRRYRAFGLSSTLRWTQGSSRNKLSELRRLGAARALAKTVGCIGHTSRSEAAHSGMPGRRKQTTCFWTIPQRNRTLENRLELGVRAHGDRVERIGTEQAFAMKRGTLERRVDLAETTPVHNRVQANAFAAHLHDDLSVGGFHLLPGARLEVVQTRYQDVGSAPRDPTTRVALLPGIAALQELGPSGQVFAGAHRGFSPVAPGQMQEVAPEVSWNYEAGARFADGQHHGELVGYFNDYRNLTGQCSLSGGCSDAQLDQQFNGGRVWVYGAEMIAGTTWWLPGKIQLQPSATYTLTLSRFRTGFVSGFPQFGTVSSGDSLPYIPTHQGSTKLGLVHDRFGFSAALSARSGMRDTAGSGPFEQTDVPGRVLLDLAAQLRADDHLEFYATLVNVTNAQSLVSWRPFGARPTAPRQLMVGLKLR